MATLQERLAAAKAKERRAYEGTAQATPSTYPGTSSLQSRLAAAGRARSQSQTVTPTLQGLSRNGYVSMADLNAETNGSSYGTMGGELGGLNWTIRDSDRKLNAGVGELERLASRNADVGEDGTLTFRDQGSLGLYQKLLDLARSAEETRSSAVTQYNDTLDTYRKDFWETQMPRTEQARILSDAIRTGEDASGFLPRQEPRAPIPGLTDVPDYLEQRQAGRGHGGPSFQAADRVREQATPEFVFEQLIRNENNRIDRELETQREQLKEAEDKTNRAQQRTVGYSRAMGMGEQYEQAKDEFAAAQEAEAAANGDIDALRGQKYYNLAEMDLHRLNEDLSEKVMQVPEWKQQAALNSGYETGDEFGGEAGQAWHQQQAGEAKEKLEALTEALRSQGFDDDQIERMYDVAQRQFNYEKTAEMTDVFSKAAGANAGTGALMTAASVPMNLASGLGHLAQTIGLITNRLRSDEDYVPLDYYDPMMQPYYGSTAIRGGAAAAISDSWAGPVGSFLYQTGTSILDSVTVAALTVATGLPAARLLSGNAATSSMVDAKARGATDGQAIAIGLFAGVFESLFEEASIDKLLTLKRPDSIRALFKNAVQQAFTEGSEEVNTTIANTIADAVIMADRSEINTTAAAYEAEGLSAGEAKAKAWLDAVKGVGLDFLGGAISGGVMGGTRSAAMYGQYQHANASLGADVRVNQALDQVIQTGLEAGEGTEAYRQALRLQEQQQEGKTLSDRKVGALQRENLQGIQYSIDELQRMQASSLPENVKEAISSLVNGDGISSNQANAIYKTEGAIPYLERIIGTKLNTDQSISGVKNDIRALASRAVAQTQNDYIRGTMGFQTEDRAVRAAGTASQNGVERGLGSIDRVTDAEAQARNRADAPALAATLGENGSRAFSTVYEADTDLYQTFEGFAQVYNAALNDKAIPETEAVGRLPGYIRDVAADAGQRDAVRASQAQYFGKDAGLVRDTAFRKMRLSVKTERVLDAIGKTAGVQVRFQDRIVDPKTGLSANARYDNGVITIARDAADPVRAAFTHEIIHRIREASPGAYTSLARFVQEHMSDRGFQFNLEQRSELYGTGDIDLLTEETVADAFGQMLGDGRALEQFAMDHRTAAQKVMDGIRELLAKIRAVLGKDGKRAEVRLTDEQRAAFQDLAGNLEEMAATLHRALNQTAQSVETNTAQKNTAPMGGNAQYQLNPDFGNQFDQWYQDRDADGNLRTGGYLRVGTTSEALQSIGVDDYAIYWDKSKLDAIMKKHPEMTADVIKEVPQILEHPILVMQSQTVANRITLYGEVTAADGSPVMVAMELRPQSKRGEIQDFAKVASAYGRNTVQRDMNTSDILYLDPNKKRTNTWLEALRLQLPAGLTKYGSIANVTYVERDVNGKISFGETGGKTDMQIAMERALQKQKSAAREDGAAKFSLNAEFARKFTAWINERSESERKNSHFRFEIGTTSAALQSIGIDDYKIYWNSGKIAKIMSEHPAMTADVIKSVPNILEHPILVMQSQTVANRITLFGSAVDAEGKPVLTALELSPQNKSGEIREFAVIASAYGKDHVQQLIDGSDILYVDPNKKRTNQWLLVLGLQLPSSITTYGSLGSITLVNRDVNGKIAFGETGGKTDMQIAMERALQTKKNTDQTDGKARYSLNADFARRFDTWLASGRKNLPGSGKFLVGTTSDVLQSLGMDEYEIYWSAAKLSKIMNEHPAMTADVIRGVPQVLERPILVMQSQTVANRITMFGDSVDAAGKPVLVAVELSPQNKRGEVKDFAVITSAYGKENAQQLIHTSDILYIEANKKRTDNWLKLLRLQLPSRITSYGSLGSITLVNRDVNGKISFGETGGKTDMQLAMERALQTKKNTDQADGGARYSLNADFERQFDQWMKKTTEAERLRSPEYFLIGNTSAALQSIGMKDYRIYFGQSKIAKIMNKHPAMTTDVIKSVPQVLEQPILVMQSQTTANRITMFGETMDADGKPVLVAVELSPQNKRGEVLDFSVIASAYGKTNAQQLIDNSDILFVEPNQKRTDSWLRLLGLQLPSRVTNYGSIASIFTVNRDVNGKISFGETGGKTDMQIAMERALQTKKNTDQTDGTARHSLKGMQKEITAQYQQTVRDILNGSDKRTDAVLMGYTPSILQEIGVPSLPFAIGAGHIYTAAKTEVEAKTDGRYNKRAHYHGLGESVVVDLYDFIQHPYCVIASEDVSPGFPVRSMRSIVAVIDVGTNGDSLLMPVEISSSRNVDGKAMDVNLLSSAYEKNATTLIEKAVAAENAGFPSVFYISKEASNSTPFKGSIPKAAHGASASGFILHQVGDRVNLKIQDQTQTRQFTDWFGDWQNKPNAASKVVNADGTPRVVYHGTAEDIHIFEEGRRGSLTRAADAREGYFFTSSERAARGYAQAAMPQELLELRDAFDRLDSRTDQDPELDRQLTEARDAFEKAFMAYRESGGGQVMPVYLSIKNPVFVDFAGESYQNNAGRVEAAIAQAKRDGNDGVILRNILDPLGPRELRETADEFIVFQSEQIKSAAENIGTFDAANPDIRRSISNKEYLERYVQEYGAIPKGEKPYRSMEVPQKTGEHQRVSQTVRTVLEAKATPDAAIPNIEALLASGDFSYGAYTDKQAIRDADGVIRKKGWDAALRGWFDSVRSGQVSKTNTALGWALYNNAANSGNVETAIDILEAMVGHQRNAAQAVQATRILKKLNPETQLYGVQRSVESLQEELNERYGEQKAPTLVIDKALAERLMKAKNQQERDSALRDIYRDIGRQMPSRFLDKWNAWRYMAMLGNPRTHVRNILGNAVFAPVVAAKNLTATAIEAAVYRVSGGRLERSKGLLGPDAGSRGLLKAAWGDYGNVQEAAMSGGKYSDLANANRYVEEGRAVFQSKAAKPLESFRKANSKALDIEDAWFSQPHYAAAMAQYCKANGITAAQVQSGKGLEKARAYAIQEAQKATYRDTNSFSQWVSGLGRGMRSGKNPVTKAAGMAMEGILPFRKTPANILVRGLEYSPLGFLDGVKKAFFDVRKERCTGAEAIDRISAGLTGTGLLGLGIFLAAQGLIRGHGGDDEPEKAFQEMMGHQAYSLELPDGTSITLDWLAPESMPFFVGVNLWEMTQGEKEPLTLSTILSAAGMVTEPLLEMSCLQSVNAVFDAVGYASSNDLSGLETVLVSAAASYLTQALPTLTGQMERTAQNIRMTTYTEKNAFLTQDMQYTLGTASGRVPGVDYQQIPYIDAWGRTESTGSTAARAANNFLNPAFTSRIDASAMEAELLRLYDATGENVVFPSRAAKYFNVASERKDLTAEEYVKYATVKGQTAYRLMGAVTAAEWYQVLSDSEKVRVVGSVYEYANALAKTTVSQYQPDGWTAKAIEAETVYGISPDVYLRLRNATADLEGIPDPRSGGDSSIDNSKGLLIMQEVFQVSGMSDRQRRALFEAFGVGKSIQHWNKTLVGDKLQELERQAQSDAAELAAAGLDADDLRTLNEIRNSAEMKSERDVRDNVIRGKSREDKLRAWLKAYEGLSNEQRKYIWKNIFGYTSRW